MKRLVTTAFLLSIFAFGLASAEDILKVDPQKYVNQPSFIGYVQDEIIVVLKDNVQVDHGRDVRAGVALSDLGGFNTLAQQFAVDRIAPQFPGSDRPTGVAQADASELSRHYKVRFSNGSLDDVVSAYEALTDVDRVERIGIHSFYATPSDFYYSYQWHLNQTSDHDIDAPEAWDIEAGADATIVAILDSGTRYYHPDLGGVNASPTNPGASRGNMWINDAELNGSSGVDDDGNGYVDDWIGYDFIDGVSNCWSGEDCNTKDNDPRDFNGHGTHTSGIFGMITNDGYGMCGVAGGWGDGTQTEYGNGVKIMALRMGYSYNYLGQEYGVVMMDAAAEAFYYAANNGAQIASCSWGSSNSGGIGAAADFFLNNGGIILVAAGNDGAEVSADYLNGRGDCISVGSTDENDNGSSFTTYGTWVDICAPGSNIYSTFHDHTDPNTDYWAAMGGTSMATPMVAGVVALIWTQNPSWTPAQVTSQLYSSTENIDAYLSAKYIGKMGVGRINAYNAVNTGPQPPVANFSGTPTSGETPLLVNFTDQSSGSPTSWAWDFGDGVGTSAAQNPSYTYTTAGSYTVTLTATNSAGSDDEIKVNYITVTDPPQNPPVANFSGSPTSGEASLMVNFTDLSTENPTSWAWDFGDGVGTSAAQNPSYTYDTPGSYTVSLTATNQYGSDNETKLDYITVTEPGVAEKAYALSDIPSLGTVTGSYANTAASDNSYEVITEAISDNHPRKVTSWAEHKWDFSVGGGTTVTFYLEAYRPNNGDGDNFVFEYSTDDATYLPLVTVASATEQVYSASLPANTSGTVWVRVTDSNRSWGNTSLDAVYVDQMYIEYESTPGPPVAEFSGTPTSGPFPLLVNFTDLSTSTPTSWSWNFGDGSGSSTGKNPSYTYTAAGTYTVSLIATNTYGSDTETKVNYITVTDPSQSDVMHVHDIVVGRAKSGPNYYGTCTVTIYNQNNLPVSGATVYVTATGPTGGSFSDVTGAGGTVSFQTSGMKKPSGEWCFEVTDVTHSVNTYDAGANNVTQACESGWVYGERGDLLAFDELPTEFSLGNHPNPFNPTTDIAFTLPTPSHVTLTVYNIVGQRVITLVDGYREAGSHTVTWSGTSFSGNTVASGIYFYRLEAGENIASRKMMLLK